jgi:hypothetical protein
VISKSDPTFEMWQAINLFFQGPRAFAIAMHSHKARLAIPQRPWNEMPHMVIGRSQLVNALTIRGTSRTPQHIPRNFRRKCQISAPGAATRDAESFH